MVIMEVLGRVVVAVLGVVVAIMLIPPFFRVLGFPVSADVLLILKVCIAGLAIFYVVRGR